MKRKHYKSFVKRNLNRLKKERQVSFRDIEAATGIKAQQLAQMGEKTNVEVAAVLADYFEVPFREFCLNPL